MSTLALTFAEMYAAVGHQFFATSTPAGATLTLCKRYVNDGYRHFLLANAESFLYASTTLVAWATATGTAVGTPSTTLTSAAAMFHPGMVGHSITVGTGTYTISAYTSSTVVTLATTAVSQGAAPALSITADGDVRLPDDFDGFREGISFAPESGYPGLLPNTPEGIRELRATDVATRRPTYFSHEGAAFSTTAGQRYNLMLWPTPDSDYTLHFSYLRSPAKMTADAEYPVGGLVHGDTILQCAYAAAELDQTKVAGPHVALRNVMLGKSILHDSQNRPVALGRASDPSVRQTSYRRDPNNWKGGVTAI